MQRCPPYGTYTGWMAISTINYDEAIGMET